MQDLETWEIAVIAVSVIIFFSVIIIVITCCYRCKVAQYQEELTQMKASFRVFKVTKPFTRPSPWVNSWSEAQANPISRNVLAPSPMPPAPSSAAANAGAGAAGTSASAAGLSAGGASDAGSGGGPPDAAGRRANAAVVDDVVTLPPDICLSAEHAAAAKVLWDNRQFDDAQLICGQAPDILVLQVGQLVQPTTERLDGWAYGTVVYESAGTTIKRGGDSVSDQERDRRNFVRVGPGSVSVREPNISHVSGWFRLDHTLPAETTDLQVLQDAMGLTGTASALVLPKHWSKVENVQTPDLIDVARDTPEWRAVDRAFQASLQKQTNVYKIEKVDRIQNQAMWQSFAVKRSSTLFRERAEHDVEARRKLVHGYGRWLWYVYIYIYLYMSV